MAKKIVSVDVDAAKEKLGETKQKIANSVKEKVLGGRNAIVGKATDLGIMVSEKQLSMLKALRKKFTNK